MNLKVFSMIVAFVASSSSADMDPQNQRVTKQSSINTNNKLFLELDAAVHTQWTDIIQHVKLLEDSCPQPAPFFQFVLNLREEIGEDLFDDILDLQLIDMAFFVKAVKSLVLNEEGDEQDEFIGINDERLDKKIKEVHLNQEGFWGDVKLFGVHGTELDNYDDLWRTIEVVFGLSESDARYRASQIHALIDESHISFDHPIFSLNAVSIAELDMIILGEGLFHFFRERDIGDGGPLYAHAHEHGHVLQMQKNISSASNTMPTMEETRRSELMGDATAAYYLAHARGENLGSKKMKDVFETAYSVGDCAVDSTGHHGTPAQRACAAMWGASQSLSVDETGSYVRSRDGRGGKGGGLVPVSSASDFVVSFDDALDQILSLDNETCYFPLQQKKSKSKRSKNGKSGKSKRMV